MIIAHKLLSSLEKVFPDEAPDAASHAAASALQGETRQLSVGRLPR